MNTFQDLNWRGLVSYTSGNVEEQLKESTVFYCGIDPTSIAKENLNPNFPEITSSLHIGHLLALITCRRLQEMGHKPIVLVGGFTGLIGDGSFRTEDRQLLSFEEVRQNTECIKKQVKHIMDFNPSRDNAAILVNNYDWMKDMSLLEFARGIGKMVSLNYMISKDSIKSRLEREGSGISLCEAMYGPMQGYDFVHLYQKYGCNLSISGHDQIGNVTYANILVRKMMGNEHELNILTWPLVTRADGKKFGKSEGGKNIWLDAHLTSPYEFYQFWLNQSDDDAKRFIKMYTLLSKEEIERLIEEHDKAPHLRILQKALAKEVTIMVHSEEDYKVAVEASEVLFGSSTADVLSKFDEQTLLAIFDGVPTFEVSKSDVANGIKLTDLCVDKTTTFKSKGELRKLIKSGGISVNKVKISEDVTITSENLLQNKFILVSQGKRNHKLIIVK